MPTFSSRGDDGINREVELELGTCDICHKAVLQEKQDLLPPPFTERQWPAVREQLEKLGVVAPERSEPLWDR